jgi:hypothetical protein
VAVVFECCSGVVAGSENRAQRHAKDVAAMVKSGDMPPWFYLPMHADAKLTEEEKQALIDGAEKSLGPQAAPEKH